MEARLLQGLTAAGLISILIMPFNVNQSDMISLMKCSDSLDVTHKGDHIVWKMRIIKQHYDC